MIDQTAKLDWQNGVVPVSRRFGDPYFSLDNGLAETRHVFLAGNGLPARFRPGFQIAELGFGTGLNMFAALLEWQRTGVSGPMKFTSFEAFPLRVDEMARALQAFPELAPIATPFLEAWGAGTRQFRDNTLIADIRIGDARETLAEWSGAADAWFLDGFAPARNPALWESALLAEVGRHTRPGGTVATYTAAGFVRRALAGAGFQVDRRAGFGRKRHMTVARMAKP